MIEVEKLSLKEITAVFLFAFSIGALLFGWFEWKQIPISYWPIGVDIYPRWVGSNAFWRGESPYSPEVDLETQSYLYGRPAEADEDPMGFYYPAYAAIVLAPIMFLPVQWSALLWTATMWAIIAFIIFAILKSIPSPTSPKLCFFVAVSIFLYRPALISVINAQYTIFIIAIWGLIYFFIRREQDMPAGFLLVLTTIKPSLSLFPLLVFLLWTLKNKRFKVFVSFIITSALFFLITFIQLGWWVPEFLGELAEYDRFPRQWVMGNVFTWPGIIWLTVTIILLYVGYKDFRREETAFPWIIFWSAISLNLLLTPHTVEYDLLILSLPFIVFAPKLLQTRSGRSGWIIIMWFPWLNYFILGPAFGWFNLWTYYPVILVIVLLTTLYFERRLNSNPGIQSRANLELLGVSLALVEVDKE